MVWPLALTLLGALGGAYLITHQPRVFRSTGSLIVIGPSTSRSHQLSEQLEESRPAASSDQAYRIKSDAVLNQVIRDLDLMNDVSAGSGKGQNRDATAMHSLLLRQLKSSIGVNLVPRTDVINVSYNSLDPQFSATLVNKVIEDFMHYSYQERFEANRRASQWPAAQLARLKDEIETTQAKMMEVERRFGNTGFNSEFNKAETSLTQLIGSAVDARLQRAESEVRYRQLLALDPEAQAAALETLPATESLPLSLLRARLDADRATRAELAVTLGANHPRVVALDAEMRSLDTSLAAARQRLLDALHVGFLQAHANQQANEAALEDALRQTTRNGPDTAEYRELLRQFSLARFLYTDLYTRLRTSSIDAGLGSIHIEVLDPAQAASEPLPADAAVTAGLLTLAGSLLGATLALALENFRFGLRSIAEVEELTDLPSLATLPRLGLSSTFSRGSSQDDLHPLSVAVTNLPVLSHPGSQFAEGMRILRTNLAMSGIGEEPKYILFTSSTPSEGKTTVAGNYALALAERGEPVLLIDADMHRPNIHHRFGFSGRQGLSSVLSGSRIFRDCLERLPGSPHLDVLPAGPVPPTPSMLLSSPAMLRLLRQAGPLYRHIVIDSPPVMAVTDGIILSQLVDAVVYVVRSGRVDRRVIRRGRDLLATSGAPLAGVVLNGLRLQDSDEWA